MNSRARSSPAKSWAQRNPGSVWFLASLAVILALPAVVCREGRSTSRSQSAASRSSNSEQFRAEFEAYVEQNPDTDLLYLREQSGSEAEFLSDRALRGSNTRERMTALQLLTYTELVRESRITSLPLLDVVMTIAVREPPGLLYREAQSLLVKGDWVLRDDIRNHPAAGELRNRLRGEIRQNAESTLAIRLLGTLGDDSDISLLRQQSKFIRVDSVRRVSLLARTRLGDKDARSELRWKLQNAWGQPDRSAAIAAAASSLDLGMVPLLLPYLDDLEPNSPASDVVSDPIAPMAHWALQRVCESNGVDLPSTLRGSWSADVKAGWSRLVEREPSLRRAVVDNQ